MIDSYYIKFSLIILGILVFLSSLIDFQSLISKLIFKKKLLAPSVAKTNKQSDFLEIISLWYQLKNKCDHFNLKIASDKLDEVFPLLNEVLEDDKTN